MKTLNCHKINGLYVLAFVLFLLLCLSKSSFGQREIKLYGGLLDYPGISLEYGFKSNVAAEASFSYRHKQSEVLFAEAPNTMIYTNAMLTLSLFNYPSAERLKKRFFIGVYGRYWQTYSGIKYLDELNEQQQKYAYENDLTVSNKSLKYSIGAIIGYKIPIGQRFSAGLSIGIGLSPKSWYLKNITSYGKSPRILEYGSNEFLGYLNHLSGVGRISFGYSMSSTRE